MLLSPSEKYLKIVLHSPTIQNILPSRTLTPEFLPGKTITYNLNYIMKTMLALLIFSFSMLSAYSQSCDEVMKYVKSTSYGTTYTSYDSDAISKVTFYEVVIDYKNYYYAIVCFKKQSYGCSEYIYQVSSSTKYNYAMNYLKSAGKAFWDYIQPYNRNLGCAPNY